MTIQTPTLLLDKNKVLKNIKNITGKCHRLGLEYRPHFKTHQSRDIGQWFRTNGVNGITVSSLKMAKYFAEDQWESITVAIPFNILESDLINELAAKVDLRLLAIDASILSMLNSKLEHSVKVYIELDPGYGRSGIPLNDFDSIEEFISIMDDLEHISLHGFYTHAGHTYKCRTAEEIRNVALPILNSIAELKQHFDYPVCYGDTPSCSVFSDFGLVEEISAGNLVFYDWTQTQIGSCEPQQIGIAMFCPVIAKYQERNELLIHGGAVHFSKDSFTNPEGETYYGVVAEVQGEKWGALIAGVTLSSISQEHGIVSCTNEYYDEIEIGDVIPILPIHSCLNADLMGEYFTTDGRMLDHMNQKKFSI